MLFSNTRTSACGRMMPPVSCCIDCPCNASSAAGQRLKGSRNTRILNYYHLSLHIRARVLCTPPRARYVFLNNLEVHEASLALVTGLIKCLKSSGVLILWFYMPDAEANLHRAQSIVSALQQQNALKTCEEFSQFEYQIQFNPHRDSGIKHLALILKNFH